MKKSLLHLFVLSTMAITITACGGDTQTAPVGITEGETIRFKVESTTWQLKLPETWAVETPSPAGTILVAQNQDQNLIIAQKPGFDENTIDRIKENAQNNFFEFTVLSQKASQLIFQGKRQVNDPNRIFYEKISPVTGTDSYLIGVCSYDFWEGRADPCANILAQWNPEEVRK